MPLTRIVRRKGAIITMEVYAEVLFTPDGPIGNFARTFTRRVKDYTSAAAPGNSRPTWGHEPAAHGKPLKASFKAATRYRPTAMKVFSAVGSSAGYATFVDQGTGIYNGGSPWRARILPPRTTGGSDLYESTWRPGGKQVAPVFIKGQKGQHFFQQGLDEAMASMGLPFVKIPGNSGGSFPGELTQHVSAAIDTGRGSAFRASLEQWRAQRDKAWLEGRVLGGPGSQDRRKTRDEVRLRANRRQSLADKRARNHPSDAQIRESNRRRQQKWRDAQAKAKGRTNKRKPPQQVRSHYQTVAEKKAAAIAAFEKQNANVRILRTGIDGILVSVGGRQTTITWAQLYGLL